MTNYPSMRFLLETKRLILQPWTEDDIEVYRALISERGKGTPSTDTVRAKMDAQHAHAKGAGIAILAIHLRLTDEVIGYCGLTMGRATLEEPEIAFELLRRIHGQGYATEAATAIVEAAMATGRTRLWATTRAWNAASLRVLQKLGFQRDRSTFDQDGEIIWLVLSFG